MHVRPVATLAAGLLVVASCVSVQPRASTGGGPAGIPGDDGMTPYPRPASGDVMRDTNPAYAQVCRGRVPGGWIPVAYLHGGDECPPPRDADDPYTAATIVRYADRTVGTVLEVCADRGVPGGWVREGGTAESTCPGARVGDGQPSSMRIRRVR